MRTHLTRAAVAIAALPPLLLGAAAGIATATPRAPAVHQVAQVQHQPPRQIVCVPTPGHWERRVWYGNNPGVLWVWIPSRAICFTGGPEAPFNLGLG
jgi:hypothetical protein